MAFMARKAKMWTEHSVYWTLCVEI
jgi:hypothetical protein